MADFNPSNYDKFTLMGVKTREENGEFIATAPVGVVDAEYYVLECINTFTGAEYLLTFPTKDPLEALEFIGMNAHINECGIEKLY